jgi:tRNA (uracil-5-)-methyltransferase TRM9
MDTETVETLCRIDAAFYRRQSESFSQTRKAPWPGWARCLETIVAACPDDSQTVSLFDLACGNLRFEAFLEESLPRISFSFYAVDQCDELVSSAYGQSRVVPFDAVADQVDRLRRDRGISPVRYRNLDIMEALRSPAGLAGRLAAPLCDVCVAFGFMHHVPTAAYREDVVSSLIDRTRPGGYVIVSFWMFLNDHGMAERARSVHEQACSELGLPPLDDGDYLLGWKGLPGQYRYCHSFSEVEIDQLCSAVAGRAEEVLRFSSDGRTGDLNSYSVFKVL